ncbi:GTP-binding protein [Phormidium yuhuli AB48]|uniref:GTP-binding protein n=1 Tax=Phormidium yuhuli AB48 TaxID=2940671 RepID=A0ABY5ASS0_9CYAN|nr:Rab family GTPase [Phormidium yuhuli]USR92277.1 GTP-binding protein [Phormidium yuhuli AB48]
MAIISKKICTIGDFSVGKTSLIRRFVEGKFSDRYLSTVGVKISRKPLEVTRPTGENTSVQLLIWDLEGHTKFKSIAPSYLQGSSGAFFVADVTRLETIERLGEHLDLFFSVNPKGVAIAGLNKSDLLEKDKLNYLQDKLKTEQGDRLTSMYLTSAKTGENVETMFSQMATLLI